MSYWLYDGFQLDNETEEAILGPQFAYYNPLLGVSEEGYTVDFDDTEGVQSKYLVIIIKKVVYIYFDYQNILFE